MNGSIVDTRPGAAMRLAGLLLALCLALVSGKAMAEGNVYYVAPEASGASDDNNGLAPEGGAGGAGPFRTLGHAAQVLTAGDTVYLRQGVYKESGVLFANSGEPDKPITVAAWRDEKPVLDGQGAPTGQSGILLDPGKSHFVFQGLTVRNMPWNGITTEISAATPYKDITIRDCLFENNGWTGLELAVVDGFLVERIVSRGNGFYGLNIIGSKDGSLSAANGRVLDSLFADHVGEEGHGLAVNQGHHIEISGCRAEHNRIHGFDISDWPKGGELSHHILVSGNFSRDNGGAGFSINSDSHHVTFQFNVAMDNGADWADTFNSGFLCYEGCWETRWYNNVAYENSDTGFKVIDRAGTYVEPENRKLWFVNNASEDNGVPRWDECLGLYVSNGGWDLTISHNNWCGCANTRAVVVGLNMADDDDMAEDPNAMIWRKVESRLGQGNISEDPEFIDPDEGDFRLEDDSPMLDAGLDVGLPFKGAAPDMGAFER